MNLLYRSILVPLRDFIYPPVCFVCDNLLPAGEDRVCMGCWNSFAQVDSCHPTWAEIREKFDAQGTIDDLLSCFLFEKEGALQDILHMLKYRGMKSFGIRLGREIGYRMIEHPEYARAEALLPVPLHRRKERERGYNQAEVICRGIQEVTGIPIDTSLLVRNKYTLSQTKLTLEERRQNVGDAFGVARDHRSIISGKCYILVDDVITTGSTINACAEALRANGAEKIFAASAALAR